MKWKRLTLLLLPVLGIALWATWSLWLQPALSTLAFIETHAGLFKGLDALIKILSAFGTLALAYLAWALGWKKPPDQLRDMPPLQPVTPGEICARMGRGGQAEWIDRHATLLTHLCRPHGRLIITGRMKIGKTREAAELIRRAVDDDLVPPDRIYEPTPALRLLTGEGLRAALRRCLDPHWRVWSCAL
jgi:hypothetical protein